jgi:hypothetical protein
VVDGGGVEEEVVLAPPPPQPARLTRTRGNRNAQLYSFPDAIAISDAQLIGLGAGLVKI